jgi:hypothetical protein
MCASCGFERPLIDAPENGGVLGSQSPFKHFQTHFSPACLLEQVKILGFMKEGEKFRLDGVRV